MTLRKKVDLNWHGVDYSLLVTMEVIDRVEDKINVSALLAKQVTGDVRLSHVARFLAVILNEAGAEVTQEDVYTGMFEDGATSIIEAQTMLGQVLSAFFPEPKKKGHTKAKAVKA